MDINEIAKEMTREEFLESDYILNKDNEDDFISYKCPYELEINNIEKGSNNLNVKKTHHLVVKNVGKMLLKILNLKGKIVWEIK